MDRIGLGLMGSRMLSHLIDAGYAAAGYARNETAALPYVAAGAVPTKRPADVASCSDIVFTILSMPDDVETVCFG